MVSRHMPMLAVAAIVATVAGPARGAEEAKKRAPAVPREGIEALEARLDRAVDRVSLPQFARLIGRTDSARGYQLPGYGLVFVLTPRALPGGESGALVLRPGRHLRHVVRLETRSEPEPKPASEPDPEEQQIESLERQVLTLQAETEEARRAAEEEMDRLVQDVRILRLAPSSVESPPPPPAAPEAPSPEAPVVAPPPPPAPPLPPSPPWKFWFETSAPEDARAPEALIADVRAAVIDALEVPAGTLSGLGGDEFVTVAVDFVPGGLLAVHARPERTLVVRARIRDVEARGRGAITPEELRQRVLVVEY